MGISPLFNRKNIFIQGHFLASYVSLQECNFDSSCCSQIEVADVAEFPPFKVVVDTTFPKSTKYLGTKRPTPLKINMEHNHGGLEDHFPF